MMYKFSFNGNLFQRQFQKALDTINSVENDNQLTSSEKMYRNLVAFWDYEKASKVFLDFEMEEYQKAKEELLVSLSNKAKTFFQEQ